MKKKLLSIALIASLVLSAAGCGETGGTTDIDSDNIGEKIDNMSDEEIEQAILDNAREPGEEAESGAAETEANTTAEVNEPEEIVYAPTQEILDADFSSLKVQINNDVFQQGGYITVAELVEQYGDRYEFTYMDGSYEERKDYLLEYKVGETGNSMQKTEWFEHYSITMTPLYGDSQYQIRAYIANLTSPDEKVTLDQAYVLFFREKGLGNGNKDIYTPLWTPKGYKAIAFDGMYSDKKTDLPSANEDLKLSDFAAYLESQGFTSTKNITNGDISNGTGNMKYCFRKNYYGGGDYCTIITVGEANPSGLKPVFAYHFYFNSNTDKIDNVQYQIAGFSE